MVGKFERFKIPWVQQSRKAAHRWAGISQSPSVNVESAAILLASTRPKDPEA